MILIWKIPQRLIKQVDFTWNLILLLKINLDKNLKYYINIENEDIFDIFKKPEDKSSFSACSQIFATNNHTFNLNTNAKKKRKKKKPLKTKKKKTKLKQSPMLFNIPSNTSFSGFVQTLIFAYLRLQLVLS
jgi:hypothetical protein